MPSEAEILLHKALKYAQETHWIRRALAGAVIGALLVVGMIYAYGIVPRSYSLTLSGGDVLSNRHFLAKILQEEAVSNGVHLVLRPTPDAHTALEMVSQHHLDMALVPGGVTRVYPHVEQVATLATETVHLVARPGIEKLPDLKGRTINLGTSRAVSLKVLGFLGLRESIDYVPTGHSDSDLVSMPDHLLPDAMFVVSLVPSYVVEYLVRERGYHLMEIPFPKALTEREGWFSTTVIPPYSYGTAPAMPAKPMDSVGVDMLLVANENANPAAIVKVMDTLFHEGVQARANVELTESGIEEPTGYPVSPAAFAYINRNDSVISKKTVDKAKDLFGAAMSLATSFLLVWKWFRPKPKEPPAQPTGDGRIRELIAELTAIEEGARKRGAASAEQIAADIERLGAIRAEVVSLSAEMKMDNEHLVETALIIVMDTRAALTAPPRPVTA